MNNNLFNEMISGFVEAKKYRAGKKAKMRVSRVAFEPVSMKPAEIRRVRTRLRFSQPEFAEFLCTRGRNSPKLGTRLPQTTKFGTPTISHCQRKTGATPTKTRLVTELSSVDGPTLSGTF